MQNTKGLQILFRENNKVFGYLSSKPANSFTPWTRHSMYDSSERSLYLESIAGHVDLYKTIQLLKDKSKEAGYTKLTLHGLNPRLNKLLNHAGFETIEVVDNYLGKRAEYMEMVLD